MRTTFFQLVLLMMCVGPWECVQGSSALQAEWKSCSGSQAAFDVVSVGLDPEVVPQGGTLSLVADINNKQPAVTAGTATVKVWWYGWWVLTAEGTICEAPAAALTQASDSLSTARRRLRWASSNSRLSSMLSTRWASSSSSQWSGWTQLSSSQSISDVSDHPHKLHAAVSDDTCVLPGGHLQLHHQASLPALAPRGNYRMQLSAADPITGQELFCLDVWFKVAG